MEDWREKESSTEGVNDRQGRSQGCKANSPQLDACSAGYQKGLEELVGYTHYCQTRELKKVGGGKNKCDIYFLVKNLKSRLKLN